MAMPTPEQVWNKLKNQSFSPPFLVLVEEQMILFIAAMNEVGVEHEKQSRIIQHCIKYYDEKKDFKPDDSPWKNVTYNEH